MGSQPAYDSPLSIEEYLSMEFEYDSEWVNGLAVPRNGGEFEHSFVLSLVTTEFFDHRKEWGLIPLISVSVQTGPGRVRVPDFTAISAGSPGERIITKPPAVVAEILSLDDTLRRNTIKAAEYRAFGIEHVWVIDPYTRVAYRGTDSGLELVRSGELTIPNTPIRVVAGELFEKLDKVQKPR